MKKIILSTALVFFAGVSVHASVIDEPNNVKVLSDTMRVIDLDEVNVNSQPKEVFRLRNQPLSASIYSSHDIEALKLRDLRELAAYVPSFAMPQYGSRLTSAMYIRGIGSRVNSPAVGIYYDGMPLMGKTAFNFYTYELDRVDVLRGPQGTLYGQNTEGGLIRMYTKNPMNYQGTDLRLGYGSHGYRNAELSHYTKVDNKFGFGIAGFYNGSNGFFKNTFSGEKADNFDEAGGKIKLVWQPNWRWDIQLLGDYQYVKQNAFPYGAVDELTGIGTNPNTNRQSNYNRHMVNSAFKLTFKGNYFDFNSTSTYQYVKDFMMMDQDYLPEDFMYLEQRQLQNSYTQEFVLKSNRPSKWKWTTGAFFSAQWLKTDAPVYFESALTNPIASSIETSMYKAMVASMASQMIEGGMQAAVAEKMAAQNIENKGGITLNVEMGAPGLYHTPQFNLGFFHESNLSITEKLTATLGLRYDYSAVKVQYDASAYMKMTAKVMGQEGINTLSSHLKNGNKNEFNQFLPKFGLKYRLDKLGSNVYALVSKGYRSGGFNIQMFSDILQTDLFANSSKAMRESYEVPHTSQDYDNIAKTIAYKPEISWNYELGTHLNLLDGKMVFDLTGYYMQVKNQQLSVMAGNYGFGRMMVNAGKSYSCGVETTLRGNAINDHLTYSLSYGYTHAVFQDYKDQITFNQATEEVNYKGNKIPFVPEHTFAAMADYRFDFSSDIVKAVVVGANVAGAGKIFWDDANILSQELYTTLGAHADVAFPHVTVSLWGKNLTNSRYNTFEVTSDAAGSSTVFAQQSNPLHFGVDVKFHF